MIITILILFFAALLGGLAARFVARTGQDLRTFLVFAGSFLFALTIVHLLPEVITYSSDSLKVGFWILVGFFSQQVLDRFTSGIEHGHFHLGQNEPEKISLILALIVHSLLEGALLTEDAPFHTGHGVYALLVGIILHKAPAAFVLMTVLIHYKASTRLQVIMLLLFSISSPLGLILAQYLLMLSSNHFVILYAIVIGIFVHVSTTIFVESNPEHRFGYRNLTVAILGAATALLLEYLQ